MFYSFTSNERNTSGLTGPIYKAEELLRQANSGPTSKQEMTSKNVSYAWTLLPENLISCY